MSKITKKNHGFSTVDVLLGIAGFGMLGIFVAIESIATSLVCNIMR